MASITSITKDAGGKSTRGTADSEAIALVVGAHQRAKLGEAPPELKRDGEEGAEGGGSRN